MAKVVIINQPLYNRGDQAAHKALIRLLAQISSIEITVLSIGSPDAVRLLAEGIDDAEYITFDPFFKRLSRFCKRIMRLPFGFLKLAHRIPSIAKYNEILKDADYVLCSPGGICMGGYQNWVHIWNLANALSLNKKVGIYGRSIGPFPTRRLRNRIFRKASTKILRKMDYISLRDELSQKIAEELNVDYIPTIDTAFAFDSVVELPGELKFLDNLRYAVFVPNHLNSWHPDFKRYSQEEFDDFYLTIMSDIIQRGYKIVMLPQLFGREKVDLPYFKSLASKYDPDAVITIADTYDSDIQQKIISKSEFLVGARYHSIIFAINNHIPFICLSYEHKMLDTLSLIGLEKYSFNIKDCLDNGLGQDKISNTLNTILNQRKEVSNEVVIGANKARAIALDAFDAFVKRL